MKKHLTLLLLLVSVCFYGQETVELEGFYKVSIGGGGHTFFPLVNNTVMAPLQLEVEIYKIPEGYVNSSRVKIKGTKVKTPNVYDCYHVKHKIIVDEIVLLDTNLLMNDFLQYYASKEKPNLKEGEEYVEYFEAEGFYTERLGEMYFIPLENGRPADTMGICFEGRASLKHNEVYPDKYVANGVYVKGSGLKITGRSYGLSVGYESQFNIAELTEIDTTRTFNKYKQERKNKEKQNIVELEGFYKVNGEEHLFFPLNRKEVNAPILLNVKEGQMPEKLNNTAFVKIKGNKINEYAFIDGTYIRYKVDVKEITILNNDLLLEDYLKEHRYDKLPKLNEEKGRVMYFEEEGYYIGRFEGHNFCVVKNNEIAYSIFPFFDQKVQDSILIKNFQVLGVKHSFVKGVYMKVSGLRTYGKFQGVFIGRDSHINISKVIEIDLLKSYWEFNAERIDRSGGCNENNKIHYFFCDFLPEGKNFVFQSREGNECTLECSRTGPYLDFVLTEKESTGLILSTKGRLIIAPVSCFDSASLDYNELRFNQIIFNTVVREDYAIENGSEIFTITFYLEEDKDGNITTEVENYGKYLYLIKVKN